MVRLKCLALVLLNLDNFPNHWLSLYSHAKTQFILFSKRATVGLEDLPKSQHNILLVCRRHLTDTDKNSILYFTIFDPRDLLFSNMFLGEPLVSVLTQNSTSIFPHLPGEGCWILSQLFSSSSFLSSSCSSSSFSSTTSASTSTSTSALPTLRQSLRQLPRAVGTAGPQRPDGMPEYMPERLPAYMPDRLPEYMPHRMPKYMRERMPHRMPEYMPDRTPKYIPDKMLEDMPDRISE